MAVEEEKDQDGETSLISAEHQESEQHRLSIIRHDSPWITFMHAHRRARALWRLCDMVDAMVFPSVGCVCRFTQRAVLSERPSAATSVCTR